LRGTTGYLVVALLGGLVGAVELASRYRDDPGRSISQPASIFYIAVNIAASIAALGIVRTFNWNFGQDGIKREVAQVLVAGFGAIALFRAKLFNAAYKEETFRWSPGGVLDALLRVSDSQVDRAQAKRRVIIARQAMTSLSFPKAALALPAYALGLLENATEDQQKRLRADVDALQSASQLSDGTKLQLLGVAVMRFTGPHLLRQAVDGLGDEIRGSPATVPTAAPTGTAGLSDRPPRRRRRHADGPGE
jgi:hypothetical protein